MSLLIPESFDLGYGHASDADLRQCIPHFVELEGLDDGDDEFHGMAPGCRLAESGGLWRVQTSRKCKPRKRKHSDQELCHVRGR